MRITPLVLLLAACAPRGAAAPVPASSPPPRAVAAGPVLPELSAFQQGELELARIRLTLADRDRRLLGARGLEALGPLARTALVDLYDCLARDPDLGVAAACARAMVAIGEPARPYLVDNPALTGPRLALAASAVGSIDAHARRAEAPR